VKVHVAFKGEFKKNQVTMQNIVRNTMVSEKNKEGSMGMNYWEGETSAHRLARILDGFKVDMIYAKKEVLFLYVEQKR